MTAPPPSRTVHGDRQPVDNTQSDGVSGWCDLGERLVEKSLTGGTGGRLLAHAATCPQCSVAVAS